MSRSTRRSCSPSTSAGAPPPRPSPTRAGPAPPAAEGGPPPPAPPPPPGPGARRTPPPPGAGGAPGGSAAGPAAPPARGAPDGERPRLERGVGVAAGDLGLGLGVADDVDRAPVRELRDRQPRHLAQRLLVVQRAREDLARTREELQRPPGREHG